MVHFKIVVVCWNIVKCNINCLFILFNHKYTHLWYLTPQYFEVLSILNFLAISCISLQTQHVGFFTFTDEFTSTVQPGRLFKALVLDAPNLIPKLMPEAIKNIQLVEGNGGPGSIQEITIVEGQLYHFTLIFTLSFISLLIFFVTKNWDPRWCGEIGIWELKIPTQLQTLT